MRSRSLLMLVLLVSACGDGDSDAKLGGQLPEATSPPAPTTLEMGVWSLLLQRLGAILDGTRCGSAECEQGDYKFVPGRPRAASYGLRVLVLDNGMWLSSTLRYADRVLAQLEMNGDGGFDEVRPVVRLPVDAARYFATITAESRFVQAREVTPLGARWAQTFGPFLDNVYVSGHGNAIFDFLADKLPDAQLIVGQHSTVDRFGPDLCALVGETDDVARAAAVQHFEQRLAASAASLQAVIERYEVDFVNLSWGLTRRNVEEIVSIRCGETATGVDVKEVLTLERRFLEALAQAAYRRDGVEHPVLLVQAAVNADHELMPDDPDYAVDCAAIPGRVRVGVYSHLGWDVPAAGSDDLTLLKPPAYAARRCTDFYINAGYEHDFPPRVRERSFTETTFGLLEHCCGWTASSSFMAPVGIALLAATRAKLGEPTASAERLVDTITQGGTRPLQDPFAHDPWQP